MDDTILYSGFVPKKMWLWPRVVAAIAFYLPHSSASCRKIQRYLIWRQSQSLSVQQTAGVRDGLPENWLLAISLSAREHLHYSRVFPCSTSDLHLQFIVDNSSEKLVHHWLRANVNATNPWSPVSIQGSCPWGGFQSRDIPIWTPRHTVRGVSTTAAQASREDTVGH